MNELTCRTRGAPQDCGLSGSAFRACVAAPEDDHTREPRPRTNGALKRKSIADAIASLTLAHGRPPTVRELVAATGSSSTGHISYHLHVLVEQGVLTMQHGKARTYVLAQQPDDPCPRCAALRHEAARLRAALAVLLALLEVAS